MRNFGKKSLDEIKERLAARGLIEAPVRDESENGTVDEVDDLIDPDADTDTEADTEVDELRGDTSHDTLKDEER